MDIWTYEKDMTAIYEIRNEDGVVQSSFSVKPGMDKWVLTLEDVVKDKSFAKSFQIKPSEFSHMLRVIGENINKDEDGKIQFKEQNAETLMDLDRIHIMTKQYGGIVSKFLTLHTEVLDNEEKFADKLEIYLQKVADAPIQLCLGIRRWKNEKPSKTGINLKEQVLKAIYEKLEDLNNLSLPDKKADLRKRSGEQVGKSAEEPERKKKKSIEDDASIQNRIQEAYATILLQYISDKSKEYCDKCVTDSWTNPSGHKQDCITTNAFKFITFHIHFANTNMLNEGKEAFRKSIFQELKKDGRLCQVIKLKVDALYDEVCEASHFSSLYLLQTLNKITHKLIAMLV